MHSWLAKRFGTAAEAGQAADLRFDLAGNIAGLIGAGAFVEIRRGSKRK